MEHDKFEDIDKGIRDRLAYEVTVNWSPTTPRVYRCESALERPRGDGSIELYLRHAVVQHPHGAHIPPDGAPPGWTHHADMVIGGCGISWTIVKVK